MGENSKIKVGENKIKKKIKILFLFFPWGKTQDKTWQKKLGKNMEEIKKKKIKKLF